MALSSGTQAPDFSLKSKTAEGLADLKLSDHHGKNHVVLLFFPLAFTSVCEEEMCSVSGGLGEYENLNAVVYGISVDSPFAQEAFVKKNGLKMTLLSDFNRKVSEAYDVLYDVFLPEVLGFEGVAKRSAFVIDPEGVIRFSWSSDDPKDLPPFEEIKAAIKA